MLEIAISCGHPERRAVSVRMPFPLNFVFVIYCTPMESAWIAGVLLSLGQDCEPKALAQVVGGHDQGSVAIKFELPPNRLDIHACP